MKKVGKVFLIIGGIFAILVSCYFAFMLFIDLCCGPIAGLAGIVYIISGFFQETSEAIGSFIGTGVTVILGGIFGMIAGVIIFGTCFLLLLLSGIFAIVAIKRKKGLNIASIILTALSIFPILYLTPSALYIGLVMLLFFWLFVLLLLTPVTWIYLAFILLVILGWLSIVFIILGNIFTLVSLKKEKQEEEIGENPDTIIEEVK